MEDAGKGKRRRPSPDEPSPTPSLPASSATKLPASGAEESAEQEEKMDKFYTLLSSIKAMRKQCRIIVQKRATQKETAAPPLWKPTFEMEDFEDAIKSRNGSSTKGEEGVERRGGDEEGSISSSGLDLSLGLRLL